jgi:predicted alpha/beta superfamily hydrolase
MKKHPPLRKDMVLLGLLFVLTEGKAQPCTGIKDTIYSTVLKENRVCHVVLPAGYQKDSPQKYDVLFVLDGEGDLMIASAILQFTEESGYIPPLIVVGVLNTDRNRDFTPTPQSEVKNSGGAPWFLSFLKRELIPFIDQKYPSDGRHVLIGHSLGGLFTVYSLLIEPDLFESCIAIDPSVWWDNNWLIRLAASKLDSLKLTGKRLFVGGREGMKYRQMALDVLDSVLSVNNRSGLTEKSTAYANETHNSIRLKSIYDGLRFVYDGYKPPPGKP